MTAYELGALVGRVILEDVEFQRTYVRITRQMADVGASGEKGAAGVGSLDAALGAAAKSGTTAATGLGKAAVASGDVGVSAARAAAAEEKAAIATQRRAAAAAEIAGVLGRTTGKSIKYQQAALSQAAADQRLAAASSEATSAQARQSAETARLASAQASALGAADRMAAVQQKAAEASLLSAATIGSAGRKMSKTLTLPIIAAGGVAIHEAAQFEKATNVYVTAAGESSRNLGVVREGLKRIARETGTSIDNLVEGQYVLEKAGYRGASGITVLDAAAKGAIEEGAQLSDVVQAMTSIMSAYNIPASKSVQVMNALKTGAGSAKVSMEDYTRALSTALPIAAANHISIEQLLGSYAQLTQQGNTAQYSTQLLSSTIRALAAPNRVASKQMQQFGLDVNDVTGKLGQRGITGTLRLYVDAITKHLGKGGLVVQDAFNKQASAMQDVNVMLGKMPAQARNVSKAYLDGKLTLKDWRDEVKGLPTDQAAIARNFASVADRTHAFNDLLKAGDPAAQTFSAMLRKMTNGAIGMNTILQLMGDNFRGVDTRAAAVGHSLRDSTKEVEGWDSTSKLAAVRAGMFKQSLHTLAIDSGTNLLPMFTSVVKSLTGVVHWFGNLTDTQRSVIGWSLAIVAGIGPVLAIGSRIVRMGVVANRGLQFLRNGFRSSAVTAEESAAAVVASQNAQATGIRAAALRSQAALASTRAAMRRNAVAAEGSAVAGGAGGVVAGGFRSRLGRGVGTGLGLAFGGQIAGDLVGAGASKTSMRSVAGSTLKGAGYGAGIGATIGSAVPVIGTALGAGVGAVVGGGIAFVKSFMGMQDAQEKARKAALSYNKVLKSEPGILASYAQNVLAGGKALAANNAVTAQAAVQRSGLVQKAAQAGLTEKDLTNAVTGSTEAFDRVVATWQKSGTASADVIGSLQRLRDQMGAGKEVAQKYADTHGVALAAEMHHASTADFLRGKLGNLNQMHLTAAQADLVYQQGVAAVTTAVRENGRTLDTNTLFGQRNVAAIRTAASQALLHAQAVYQQTGSLSQADAALARDRNNLIRHAEQAGLSRAAVQRLVASIFSVHDKRAKINVDTAAAQRSVASFGSWFSSYIQGLSGRVVPLYVKTVKLPGGGGVAKTPHGGTVVTGGSAAGSRSWTADGKLPPGLSTVGERGWELARTDASGRTEIISHANSVAMTGMPDRLPGFAGGTSPSSNYAAIADLLRSLGATRAGIAGFLGNTKIESGGRLTAVGGPAHGLQQWQDGRFRELQRLAASMNVSWKSRTAQLAMIKQELTHGYKGTLNVLRHAKSARQAAAYVDAHYEISSGAARGARMAAAASFEKQLRSGKLKGAAREKAIAATEHPLATSMKSLFSGSQFTSGVITAVRNGVESGVTVSFKRIAAPTMASFLKSASRSVDAAITAATRPADTTVAAQKNTLIRARTGAIKATEGESVAKVLYDRAQANANTLQRNLDRIRRAQHGDTDEAAKLRARAADLRARASKLARHDGDKGEVKRLRDRADALAKQARDASKLSKQRRDDLRKEADAASKAAQSAKAAAQKQKDAWKAAADAAKDAQQAAAEAAKTLVEGLQQQADTLASTIADFKKTVTDGLTSGSDLSGEWGKAQTTAAAANATQARKDAEAIYAAAQANLRAVQARIATAGGTPADYAALTAAQQAQTDALAKLTAAQDAESTAASNLASSQKDAAQQAVTAAQLQAQFDATLASTQTFAADLKALAAAGANQDIISQVVALGPEAGDAMAKSLLQAGTSGIAALEASMKAISDVANSTGDTLAGVFYAKGQNTLLSLIKGLESQFPALKAALDPIVAAITAALKAEGQAVTPPAKAAPPKKGTPAPKKTPPPPAKKKAAVIPPAADTILGHLFGVPAFANGVTDFAGGLALVHQDEALINLPAHTSVMPSAQTHRAFDMSESMRPVEEQLRELNARVDVLAPRIGDAMTEPMARYGKAHAEQVQRAGRRRP